MIASLTACLVTDALVEESPPSLNHAPVIVETDRTPRPKNSQVIRPNLSRGCETDLAVDIVSDEDLDQVLEARWFIDYDYQNPAPAIPGGEIPKTGQRDRPGGGATRFLFDARSTAYAKGLHVVELVVSDGFADEDGRRVLDGQASASYAWFIDTTNSTDCTPTGGI